MALEARDETPEQLQIQNCPVHAMKRDQAAARLGLVTGIVRSTERRVVNVRIVADGTDVLNPPGEKEADLVTGTGETEVDQNCDGIGPGLGRGETSAVSEVVHGIVTTGVGVGRDEENAPDPPHDLNGVNGVGPAQGQTVGTEAVSETDPARRPGQKDAGVGLEDGSGVDQGTVAAA